ncbi:M20/M25/M40 family metallo-hydrolase [Nocardioides sp. KC13]|uniref:M20/M25/M40 family metallo-hydrolase n=1 Tax=Nocardioides turkmenicus TaxID=2711220 RepID=A0A6M1R087_9ACTN|nr:M20/M25/M40 family metallo-hydrolase [Nocardioides sp. KC13]NGN95703.1 M20/M25/M40 family metallo-hydrolase [Nocardioides sp. KC13]
MTPDPVAALQATLRAPTVNDGSGAEAEAFAQLHEALREHFPRLHATLDLTPVGGHGLLFRWPGASAEKPVVLMAHQDVVPIAGEWTHDPFGGEIVDGVIHGRGTLDDKGQLVAICAAVEGLLADGFAPAYDVWLSFGSDEETTGAAARAAVEELRARGVEPWFVLDEGGAVAFDAFPGVAAPIGVVGVAEKGTTDVRLRVTGDGGHSSTPRQNGPTARLARAITRIDRMSMPVQLPAPTVEMFEQIAPYAAKPLRPVLANAGRLAPALARLLPRLGPEPAALTRTTVAITTLEGSPAANVIASAASAGVNLRIMIGETVAEVVERLRAAIGDKQVEIEVVRAGEPSPVSPRDEAFATITAAIGEVFPEAVPAPYTVMAATDSRFFYEICDRVYRFAPFRMTAAQRATIHAADENIRVDDYLDGIRFYRRLIESL